MMPASFLISLLLGEVDRLTQQGLRQGQAEGGPCLAIDHEVVPRALLFVPLCAAKCRSALPMSKRPRAIPSLLNDVICATQD
jgi:hypothetical protein